MRAADDGMTVFWDDQGATGDDSLFEGMDDSTTEDSGVAPAQEETISAPVPEENSAPAEEAAP